MKFSKVIITLKKVKCAIFCDKPYRLLDWEEKVDEGIFRAVICPKCGSVYGVLNRKDNTLK